MKPLTLGENSTHSKSDRLLEEAEQLLEQHCFADSIAAFREAALLTPLTHESIFNLSVAEDGDRIDFRRRLTDLFPGSIDLALAEVETLVRAKFGRQAVARCADLLRNLDLTPEQTLLIRHARFQAAKEARDPALFAADFIYLWSEPIASKYAARSRLSLLQILIEVGSPSMIAALKLIREQFGHESELMRIVDSKVEQLILIERLNYLVTLPDKL